MRRLSLDQSTTMTGWAFGIDDQPPTYGRLKTPTKAQLKKLDQTAQQWQALAIMQLVTDTQPDVISVEGIHSINIHTAIMLAEFKGYITGKLEARGFPVVTITSADVQHFMHFGFRVKRALKKERARFVATAMIHGETWAMSHNPEEWIAEDEADALVMLAILKKSRHTLTMYTT